MVCCMIILIISSGYASNCAKSFQCLMSQRGRLVLIRLHDEGLKITKQWNSLKWHHAWWVHCESWSFVFFHSLKYHSKKKTGYFQMCLLIYCKGFAIFLHSLLFCFSIQRQQIKCLIGWIHLVSGSKNHTFWKKKRWTLIQSSLK